MSGQAQTYQVCLVRFALNNVNQLLIFHKTLTPFFLAFSHDLTLFPCLFLKVMTCEGRERRSKHREAAGASSSRRAPVTHPKKLANRAQPSSLHEDSTPEDSPPHGASPDSPDEFECLKMRPPVAHTNREVVNYNKVDPRNIVTLRQKACYNSSKERGTDEHF
jgi:hypothetical protein